MAKNKPIAIHAVERDTDPPATGSLIVLSSDIVSSSNSIEPAKGFYTDPPLGRAGMTEAEVRKTGKPALISVLAMNHVSRAVERGETKGFMKILADRDSG